MRNIILCLLALNIWLAAASCEKEWGTGLYFKSVYQDYFYGNGREKLEYPGYMIRDMDAFNKVSRDIDVVNQMSAKFREEPLNFEHYVYLLLVDSIRDGALAKIHIQYADVDKDELRVFFRTSLQPDTPGVAMRQAFQFVKLDRRDFKSVRWARMQ